MHQDCKPVMVVIQASTAGLELLGARRKAGLSGILPITWEHSVLHTSILNMILVIFLNSGVLGPMGGCYRPLLNCARAHACNAAWVLGKSAYPTVDSILHVLSHLTLRSTPKPNSIRLPLFPQKPRPHVALDHVACSVEHII